MEVLAGCTNLGNGASLFSWSPNGRYCAVISAKQCRLVIRDASDLQVIRSEVLMFNNDAASVVAVDKLAFSPDSEFVLVSSFKTGTTLVVRVLATDWKARITESEEVTDVVFAPDSRHVLTFAQFNVKLTIWSLTERRVRYIKMPRLAKFRLESHNNWSEGSTIENHLAVLEHHTNKPDTLSLFSSRSWCVERHFQVPDDVDGVSTGCTGMAWSPRGDGVVCLYADKVDYDVRVYSVDDSHSGNALKCLMTFRPPDPITRGMGLRCVQWSPCGSLLVLGGGDSTIQVFNSVNWCLITQLEAPNFRIELEDNATVYEEQQVDVEDIDVDVRIAREWTSESLVDTRFVPLSQRPIQLVPATTSSKNSPCGAGGGVCHLSFSPDGRYLCTRLETLSAVVFIWNVVELSLETVLVHRHRVISVKWSPTGKGYSNRLLISTHNSSMLHCWTPGGVACLSLPPVDKIDNSNVGAGGGSSLLWNPKGKAVALVSKSAVIVCRVGDQT